MDKSNGRGIKKEHFYYYLDGGVAEHVAISKLGHTIVDDKFDNYEEFIKCNTGSSVIFNASIVESKGKQEFEAQAKSIDFFSKAEDDYPLQKKGT